MPSANYLPDYLPSNLSKHGSIRSNMDHIPAATRSLYPWLTINWKAQIVTLPLQLGPRSSPRFDQEWDCFLWSELLHIPSSIFLDRNQKFTVYHKLPTLQGIRAKFENSSLQLYKRTLFINSCNQHHGLPRPRSKTPQKALTGKCRCEWRPQKALVPSTNNDLLKGPVCCKQMEIKRVSHLIGRLWTCFKCRYLNTNICNVSLQLLILFLHGIKLINVWDVKLGLVGHIHSLFPVIFKWDFSICCKWVHDLLHRCLLDAMLL